MNSMKFNFEKYIRSNNEDKIITVGQTIDGKYVVNIEQVNTDGHKTIANMMLPEKDFVGLISAILIFAERNKLDITQKIHELFEPDKITYISNVLTEVEQE